ncbi:MAG TPA: hypothetical protein VIV60_10420 [Polyangiaceae bacterium]
MNSMTPELDDRTDPPVLGTLTTLVHRNVRPLTPEQLRRGWTVVSARVAARDVRRRNFVRLAVAALAVPALAALMIGLVSFYRSHVHSSALAAMTYEVQGGSIVDGGYLREAGNRGVKLVFAEGSEFLLMPGTRSRLGEVYSNGARIAIEQGAASFQITPRSNANWLVDVGPFLVTVKGTVFTVSWDAATERFELRLQHGQVSVTGPLAGGTIPLRAGQRLAVDLPREEITITEQKPEDVWPGSPQLGSTVSTADLSNNEQASRGIAGRGALEAPVNAVPRTGTKRAWAEAAAVGDWDQILADVDRLGAKRALAEVSSEELFVLADAARYRGRAALAQDALLAERKRFPGSSRALDAIFLLGRLEESNQGGFRSALARYEEYLARAPTGTYASEALGRKMIATRRLEGAVRAKPVAEEYLLRFPSGTYAGAARALLQTQ